MARDSTQQRRTWRSRFRRILGRDDGHDPASLFAGFRAVLASNNRALEVITDLGEKLGGDYLFDVNYTRAAYGELFTAISSSLTEFSRLTGGAHPELADILARIDRQVRRVLDDAGPDGPLLVLHRDITWDLAGAVGGKNYNLAMLANDLHLRTPDAFAVTTRAFDLFLVHNGLADRVRELGGGAGDEALLAGLRQAVLDGNMPPEMEEEMSRAVRRIAGRRGRRRFLAVRSSGEEEDGDLSFAGQFESVLNVPAETAAVAAAWRRVAASLFAPAAAAYQRQMGYGLGRLRMAVACMVMVDARVSGVVHTVAGPGQEDTLLVNAAWGLGPAVVDGITDADRFLVKKGDPPEITSARTGRKEVMVVREDGGGTGTVPTPEGDRGRACLSGEQVLELARLAMRIEEYFRSPQDIEWAVDGRGRIFILQSRPLRVDEPRPAGPARVADGDAGHPVLLRGRGEVVRHGTTAGRVFMVRSTEDLERVPRGAVLVARHDSPQYVRAIPFVNAIITDTGVATSHMASICREFAVPTVVNAVDATTVLTHGSEVTLRAGSDGSVTVYAGIVHDLLREERRDLDRLRQVYEFRRQKYLMRYIAPLHLVNPLEEDFRADRCRSIHDLIRFMHEKAVQALVAGALRQAGRLGGRLFGRNRGMLRDLSLPLPVRMLLIDIGGALAPGSGSKVAMEDLRSRPLLAILGGMLAPGAWSGGSTALTGRDFLAGMTRAADPGLASAVAGANLAVASADYVNLSLRFGYHFNVLDSYCTANPRNNHIFFRFVGGAASLTSRSLRVRFMARVMDGQGFITRVKGDLLVARISNIPAGEVERLLTGLGRLVGCARQLDAVLTSEAEADRLADDFLAGRSLPGTTG